MLLFVINKNRLLFAHRKRHLTTYANKQQNRNNLNSAKRSFCLSCRSFTNLVLIICLHCCLQFSVFSCDNSSNVPWNQSVNTFQSDQMRTTLIQLVQFEMARMRIGYFIIAIMFMIKIRNN